MLFEDTVYQECLDRINKITPESQPKWGKMDAAQMFAHVASVQDVTNGKPLENTPFMAKLFKGFIRKMVVNEKPYKKSSQTHPQFLVANAKDFAEQKAHLLQALETFRDENKDGPSPHVHSLFGKMTHQEKGWSMYKHLDHHLQQFGV